MRNFISLALLGAALVACTSQPADSNAKTGDTGAGDSGPGPDTGVDTGPSDDATITGGVITFDGSTPTGMAVTFCQTACYSGKTTDGGQFAFNEVPPGDYKLDAIGEGLNDDWGHIRVPVHLDAKQMYELPIPLYVPHQPALQLATYGQHSSLTFDGVTMHVDGGDFLEEPQADTDDTTVALSAGLVLHDDIPAFWEVEPSFAIPLLPFATEVLGPFDVDVVDAMGDFSGDSFDVYAVGEHGETEGPLGTATRDGDTLSVVGIQPAVLTWLLFVPA